MNRSPVILLLCMIPFGCQESSPPPDSTPARKTTSPPPSEPAWQEVKGSKLRALTETEREEILAQAMRDARETMDDARVRWQAASNEGRMRWAVLWAAPTIEGGVEYLWVLPATWSEFRIEGALANPPQHELASGKEIEGIVSFPIDELADWAVFQNDSFDSVIEGGFTLRAIEERASSS